MLLQMEGFLSLKDEKYSIVYMCVCVYTYFVIVFSLSIHSGCFHILAVMNSVAMDLEVSESALLGCMISHM